MMKVSTDIKSGNWMDQAWQAASDAGVQVSSFVNDAEQQAADLTGMITDTMSSLKHGFSNLLGLG
jgi:hypothetical protein